ncbi:receptor-like protein 46 [Quercus lobata]|uniref:receptor-like protein 46 n=1 Tax=Quercus lobata TaxID=97700 RepID=UPI0012487C08|nr:receptor-like protein 46 [Quercus lobata]
MLKTLNLLDLSDNQLEGMFPQWLVKIKVRYLFLSNNNFTGSLPPGLFDNPYLELLSLSWNNFYGELPNNIGNVTSIKYLMLDGNNFSGTVPESINNLDVLFLLDLSNNRFFGNFFPALWGLSPIIIDLSSNEFSGEFQVDFLSNTNVLVLGKNKFSGSLSRSLTKIPLKFGKLTGTMETPNVFLDDVLLNNFYNETGDYDLNVKIHDLIVNWKKSKQGLSFKNLKLYSLLDLSSNQLSGEIPASLGSLKALKLLNVSFNNLHGRIPKSLGGLKNLESLDLPHNNLLGSIPQSLAKLQ